MQDKSKLGKRYQCFVASCGIKFYDLNRPVPLCPRCGADQTEHQTPDPRDVILARFKSKVPGAKGLLREDTFDEDEEADEEVDLEGEDVEEEDDDAEPEAEAEEEEP